MKILSYPQKILQILIGSIISAVSINMFLLPNGLLTGGIAGIGVMLYYLLKIPVGLTVLLFNIPIFLLGLRYLHRGYIFRTFLGVGFFSIFLSLTQNLPKVVLDDLLIPALFAGALNGIGFGLIFRGRGSSGGTDVIALILNKFYSLGIGTVSFAVNTIIMLVSAFLFDIKFIGYTLISMFVSGYVVDQIQIGLNRAKSVMIISDKANEMASQILKEIRRGVTFLQGEGAFTQSSKRVILTMVTLTQLAKLKDVVASVDKDAFMVVSDASEVLGRGFRGRETIDAS